MGACRELLVASCLYQKPSGKLREGTTRQGFAGEMPGHLLLQVALDQLERSILHVVIHERHCDSCLVMAYGDGLFCASSRLGRQAALEVKVKVSSRPTSASRTKRRCERVSVK